MRLAQNTYIAPTMITLMRNPALSNDVKHGVRKWYTIDSLAESPRFNPSLIGQFMKINGVCNKPPITDSHSNNVKPPLFYGCNQTHVKRQRGVCK